MTERKKIDCEWDSKKKEIQVACVRGGHVPRRAYETDAGADIRCIERFVIHEHDTMVVDTGLAFAIPPGYFGWVAPKSGLASKGITVDGGIIDASYRGTIKVVMRNTTAAPAIFEDGQKIAQIIIIPCELVDFKKVPELEKTDRGKNGFGSTGK